MKGRLSRRPIVLLVEDFPDALEMYSAFLEHSGFRVIGAVDAPAGLASARVEQPDVIVMDGSLPGMTGWEAITVLKSDPNLRTIPTLMLTAHIADGARERAMNAGADGFIPKPCLPDELAREIRTALATGRGKPW
jgi:CheY-like chemotaxis protein